MNYENYFNDIFESIPDYRKIVLIMFLIENDSDLLKECGFSNMILFDYLKNLKLSYLNKMRIM